MNGLIIEVIICIGFILLFYQCCVKGARLRQARNDTHRRDNDHEDLRRFRERLSERAATTQDAWQDDNDGASAAATRKEMIEKNLFCKVIEREESVRELSGLLAISRGGDVDEELGGRDASPADVPSGGPTSFDKPDRTGDSSLSESSMPAASAPPATTAAASTDTIATAISSPPPNLPTSNTLPRPNPITLEPIRNLWSNLAHNIQSGSERGETTTVSTTPAAVAAGYGTQHVAQKLECSICLDQYSPNETIAWAKDGGDPPTLTSTGIAINNEMGCDHIFHKECIVAWLQEHDDCPLCRRKVVHADADLRFAGWEVR